MSRVLVYTSPARGHLFPVVPIGLELLARGHQVSVRTLSAQVPQLTDLGFDAAPLGDGIETLVHDDWKARTPLTATRRSMRAFGARAPLEVPDLRSALEQEQPDVLLVDIMAFGAVAAAEASGLPWAAWLPYPAWLRSPGIPPYGLGFPPLGGRRGRLRDAGLAVLTRGPERMFASAVNRGRAAAGLGPVRHADDVLRRAPALLSMTAEPFEHHRQWPASFHLIGPCAWEPAGEAPDTGEDRPVVLVSTSSEFQDDGALVTAALAALAGREDLLVVATVPAGDPSDFACPANGRVERFAPHGPLLARAVAVVCHAGMGITQKALAAGVPVCAVPFGRDQHEVAARVVASGSGVRLARRRLTPARLRTAVETTMTMADGAKRVQAGFASAGGPARAATVVEQLIPPR